MLKITGQLALACMLVHLAGLCYIKISLNMPLHASATGLGTLSAGLAFLSSNQMQLITFLRTGSENKNSVTW